MNESASLGYRVPGASLPGRKVMTQVHRMLAGADSIDDMDIVRVDESLARVHRAGHRTQIVLRADSGFENKS